MDALPLRPRGSEIWTEPGPGGPTLMWRPASGRAGRLATAAFLAVWLAVWALGGVGTVFGLIAGNWEPANGAIIVLVWLPFWAVGLVMAARIFALLVESPRAESLTLGGEALRYDPGSSPLAEAYSWGGYGWADVRVPPGLGFCRELFRRRQPLTLSRTAVTGARLDRAGRWPALVLEIGAGRVEVGPTLREADRAWLHAVLDHWRAAGVSAPPDSAHATG